VEACCVMQTKAARGEAREGLHSDGQLRWWQHRGHAETHQEGTVAGCHRGRPRNVAAMDRMAATWVLDHLREMAEEGLTDGGVMGVEMAMDGSRDRCFLRARHELASVALQAVVGNIASLSRSSAGLGLRGEGRQVGRVPAAKAAIVSRERAGAVGASRWRRLVEFYRSTCTSDKRVTATRIVYRDRVAMPLTQACSCYRSGSQQHIHSI